MNFTAFRPDDLATASKTRLAAAGKRGLPMRDVWRIIVDKWHVQPLALPAPQPE